MSVSSITESVSTFFGNLRLHRIHKNVTQLSYVCLNNIEGFCVRKELLLLCVEAGAKGLLILISLLIVVAGLAPTGCKTENILGEAYLIFLTTLEQCRTGNGSCLCRCMTGRLMPSSGEAVSATMPASDSVDRQRSDEKRLTDDGMMQII